MKSGDLSANYFQTIPYLEDFAKQHNLDYEILVSVHLEPLGLYSKKVKSLKDIPDGSQIAIPSDPTNEGRALKVLEYSGLIKLREGATLLATTADIVENPKKLKFVELEAAQLPRSLDDLTVAAVNGNYAYVANLNPKRDGILSEDAHGSYVCNIVVNDPDKNQDWARVLVEAYRSPSVREFIEKKYDGAVLAAF